MITISVTRSPAQIPDNAFTPSGDVYYPPSDVSPLQAEALCVWFSLSSMAINPNTLVVVCKDAEFSSTQDTRPVLRTYAKLYNKKKDDA